MEAGSAGRRQTDRGWILLGTSREWFESALEAVLRPEGWDVRRADSVPELEEHLEGEQPDALLLDGSIPGITLPELCRRLTGGVLAPRVPLFVVAESHGGDRGHAEVLESGAWEVLLEPIRPRTLVASLARMIELGCALGEVSSVESGPLWDDETDLFTEAGLARILPSLRALAGREDVRVSCVVVGPTRTASDVPPGRRRVATAELSLHLRSSDVCGWLGNEELAVLAFDTPAEGAVTLAERLTAVAADRFASGDESRPLSAGIVELSPPSNGAEAARPSASLASFRLARDAMSRARQEGGGIHVGEVA